MSTQFISVAKFDVKDQVTSELSKRHPATDIEIFRHENGLELIFANTAGPFSSAEIIIPTLCDEQGTPSALKQMVLAGTKTYPKGYLNEIAKRCLCKDPLGFVNKDHTLYRLSGIGQAGLIHTIPVLLEHIMEPSFEENDFKNEVYHVDQNGNEQGILYNQLLHLESLPRYQNNESMLKLLYPYLSNNRSQSQGYHSQLHQLTLDKVKAYHQKYYCYANISIFYTGHNLPKTDIIDSLNYVIQENNEVFDKSLYDSLFEKEPSQPTPTTIKVHTDENPVMTFGWKGPKNSTVETEFALRALLDYITTNPASSILHELCSPSDPIAKSVDYYLSSGIEFPILITLKDLQVKSDYDKIQNLFLSELQATIESMTEESFQETYKGFKISQLYYLEDHCLSYLENYLEQAMVEDKITGVLNLEKYQAIANILNIIDSFANKPLSYWKELAQKWLISHKPCVVITISNEDIVSISKEQQKPAKKLKPESKPTENIKIDNNFDQTILNKLPSIPKVFDDPVIQDKHVKLPSSHLFTKRDVIQHNTNFIEMKAGLPINNVPENLLDYLHLLRGCVYNLDMEHSSLGHLDGDKVSRILNAQTNFLSSSIGLRNNFPVQYTLSEYLFLNFATLPENFQSVTDLIVDNFIHGNFIRENVLIAAQKTLELFNYIDASEYFLMKITYSNFINNKSGFNSLLQSKLSVSNQRRFLTNVISLLSSEETAPQVLVDLSQLRSLLITELKSSKIVSGIPLNTQHNPEQYIEIFETSWEKHSGLSFNSDKGEDDSSYTISNLDFSKSNKCQIMQIKKQTTSFAVGVVPCNILLESNFKYHIAIKLLCQIFSSSNGPFSNFTKSLGYTQKFNFNLQPTDGALTLKFAGIRDPVAILRQVWTLFSEIEVQDKWDQFIKDSDLALAKAALRIDTINILEQPSYLFYCSIDCHVMGFDSLHDYMSQEIQTLSQISIPDLRKVFLDHFLGFLDPQQLQMLVFTPESDGKDFLSHQSKTLSENTFGLEFIPTTLESFL